jgi:hypothetical protein
VADDDDSSGGFLKTVGCVEQAFSLRRVAPANHTTRQRRSAPRAIWLAQRTAPEMPTPRTLRECVGLQVLRAGRRAGEFEPHGRLSVDTDLARQEERVRERLGQFDFDVERITRTDGVAELRVVNPRDDRDLSLGDGLCSRNQNRTGLERRFELNHAGQNREMRIVAAEDVEVRRNVFAGDDLSVVEAGDLVDPEERIAVGNELFDLGALHLGINVH